MKSSPIFIPTCLAGVWLAGAVAAGAATESAAAEASTSPAWEVAERGQDFAVYQRVATVPLADGSPARRVLGQFTLLENGLHYRDPATGTWQPSRDLIESFPDGAIARFGPLRAIFSHDVNAESVFDLETPAGTRLRGGVRALEWLDEVTGARQLLAVVRASAPLELVSPHRLVARDAFEGVLADVVLEWRHNRFSQSVVLRQLPEPPAGFEARATRLVVVTEFVEAPEPAVQRVALGGEGLAPAEDHVGIHFDGASILVGHAFAAEGIEPALQVGTGGASGEAVSVRKSWTPLPGGGAVLEESVGWEALAALGAALPRQARAGGADERTWRTARAERGSARRPVAVAQAPYRPAGLVVDFELSGSVYSYTFAMGQTYYIPNSFNVGPGVATFEPGCTIKYANNAWLRLTGPISFADTLQTPVFTSKDDNSFGEQISGSTGSPTHHASPAVGVYYDTYSTTISKARFRWAKTAVQYDSGPGYALNHTLQNSLFEHCWVGVRIGSGVTVSVSGLEKHNVATNFVVTYPGSCGSCTMTQTPFYTDKSFAGLNGNDGTVVPDTMGAIGPDHFLTTTTSGKIAVFDRGTGNRLSEQSLSGFFGLSAAKDPRVWYDNGSQRWVVSAMDSDADTVAIKLSLSSSASLDASNWRRYVVVFSLGQGEGPDFPTLGVDANGVYLSTQIRASGAQAGYRIWALKKPDVYTDPNYQPPAPLIVTAQELDTWCIQPAYNFDANPSYAWFVAKGKPQGQTDARKIAYRRLQWSGSSPLWADASWQVVSDTSYLSYYDIPQDSSGGLGAPQSGGSIKLGYTGSRLMAAVIRGGYLWTCHHVGVDGTDGDYDGPTADRSAVQWLRLQVGPTGLTYSVHGRIFDAAPSSPYWYYFPSLNVDASGNAVFGFSGSKAGEHVGGFFQGRKANGTWMARPGLVQAGRSAWGNDRWGDYSATSADPNNGSLWTVQEYADPAYSAPWGTWITQVGINP